MATSVRRNRSLLMVAGLAAVAAIGPAESWGQVHRSGSPAPSYEGILVLHNGNLLQGTITQADQRYHVAVDGGLIHVSAGDVAFTCRTLEEAYGKKRGLIQPGVARDHLELAQWCQRHGLLETAAQELVLAKALEPRHPLIPLVEQRIKTSLCEPNGAARPAQSRALAPSPEELDRLVRTMPAGSVETFTQKIQPLLVNSCAAAGCHGPGTESQYQLLRPSWGKPAGRRLTQRNLQSTLEWVDRDNPSASKLLTAPIEGHGSAEGAVFKDHQADQYQRIVEWVYQVAQKDSPPRSLPDQTQQPIATPDPSPSAVVPAVHTATSALVGDAAFPGTVGVRAPNSSLPIQGLNPGSTRLAPSMPPVTGGLGIRGNSFASPLAPADPFDAGVFNRRFFPERQRGKDASSLPTVSTASDRQRTGPPRPSAGPNGQ